jgi:hypothetical protein
MPGSAIGLSALITPRWNHSGGRCAATDELPGEERRALGRGGDRRQVSFAKRVDEKKLDALPFEAFAGGAHGLDSPIDRFVAHETGLPATLRL